MLATCSQRQLLFADPIWRARGNFSHESRTASVHLVIAFDTISPLASSSDPIKILYDSRSHASLCFRVGFQNVRVVTDNNGWGSMTWRAKIELCGDNQIAAAMTSSIESLLDSDGYLFLKNVHERTISSALAFHMRGKFGALHVDPEFNKLGDDVKGADIQGVYKSVIPDIIVHKRGVLFDNNLLVIEIKCAKRGKTAKDIQKLRGMRQSLKYRYALFLRFGVKERAGDITDVQWVTG